MRVCTCVYVCVSVINLSLYLRFPNCLVRDSRVSTAATLDRAKSRSSGKWAKADRWKTRQKNEIQFFFTNAAGSRERFPCRHANTRTSIEVH